MYCSAKCYLAQCADELNKEEEEDYCYTCKAVLKNSKFGMFCSEACADEDYEALAASLSPSNCLHCDEKVKKGQVYCSEYCAVAEIRKDDEDDDSSYEENHCPNCFEYNGLLTHPPLPYCSEMCAKEAKKKDKKKGKKGGM